MLNNCKFIEVHNIIIFNCFCLLLYISKFISNIYYFLFTIQNIKTNTDLLNLFMKIIKNLLLKIKIT